MPDTDTIILEGVRIIRRNFRGEEDKYNKPGERNFIVVLPSEEMAEQLAAADWNVKWFEPREEGEEEERVPWLPVEVAYQKGRPPRIFMIPDHDPTRRTELNEESVAVLDGVDIVNVDMIVRGSHWSNATGASGVKAYLQSMYVTIEEDYLARKYAEMDKQFAEVQE